MTKEEYLKKFEEYNETLQDLIKTYKNEQDEFEKASEKFYKTKTEITEKIANKRKEICSLYKKIFNDKNIYIKTGSEFYKPKNEDLSIPGSNMASYYYLTLDNIKVCNINNIQGVVPLTNYLKENMIDTEDENSRDLLKEIEGETNDKGNYVLVIVKRLFQYYHEYYYEFRYGLARDIMMPDPSTLSDGNTPQILIKFFKKRKELNAFLLENFNNISGEFWYSSTQYYININQPYFKSRNIKKIEDAIKGIKNEFEVYKEEPQK